ncbi:MAG: NAD(P)H-dependent oxidoreductase [Lewinella sp.]|nr:NAD(P)H-dependent oxidoreductase [Lewinella sp.]
MITVISGSNRKGTECLTFATAYAKMLRELTDEPVKLLALDAIPHDWFHADMYDNPSPSIIALQDEYILPADKFAFFSSEYNGGFNGALKLFLDAVSVRRYSDNFKGKKAALIGVASGRAGNLRGMDHLTGILNHVGAIVMPNKLPISRIEKLLDDDGELIDPPTLQVLEAHARELVDF